MVAASESLIKTKVSCGKKVRRVLDDFFRFKIKIPPPPQGAGTIVLMNSVVFLPDFQTADGKKEKSAHQYLLGSAKNPAGRLLLQQCMHFHIRPCFALGLCFDVVVYNLFIGLSIGIT